MPAHTCATRTRSSSQINNLETGAQPGHRGLSQGRDDRLHGWLCSSFVRLRCWHAPSPCNRIHCRVDQTNRSHATLPTIFVQVGAQAHSLTPCDRLQLGPPLCTASWLSLAKQRPHHSPRHCFSSATLEDSYSTQLPSVTPSCLRGAQCAL